MAELSVTGVLVLNDQGGAVMDVAYGITGTLRAQDHGHPPVICLEGNGARPSHRGGGYSEDGRMFTLNTIERHSVCYGIVKLKNDGNPHSGCHETNVCCTLDCNGAHPNCEQGGVLIVSEKCETHEEPAVYDARGNGRGGCVPTLTGDHENRITDYTTIAVIKNESLPNDNRSIVCEQPSRELHRTGCVQRYAAGDGDE